VNSLPKTVTRQRRDCDLNPGSSAPESSTLTTRLPSHPLGLTLSIDLLSAGPTAANPPQRHAAVDRCDGQVDKRTDRQAPGHRTVT